MPIPLLPISRYRSPAPVGLLLAALWVCLASMPAMPSGTPQYIGYEGCQMCHRAQHADWQRSVHARAFDLLKPGVRNVAKRRGDLDPDMDYTGEQKCLQCHTTGYGKPGGFVSIRLTPTRAGVGCEGCHGPGGHYREIHKAQRTALDPADVIAAGQVYGSKDPQVCRDCHVSEDIPFGPEIDDKYNFDHEARLGKTRAFHRHYR